MPQTLGKVNLNRPEPSTRLRSLGGRNQGLRVLAVLAVLARRPRWPRLAARVYLHALPGRLRGMPSSSTLRAPLAIVATSSSRRRQDFLHPMTPPFAVAPVRVEYTLRPAFAPVQHFRNINRESRLGASGNVPSTSHCYALLSIAGLCHRHSMRMRRPLNRPWPSRSNNMGLPTEHQARSAAKLLESLAAAHCIFCRQVEQSVVR